MIYPTRREHSDGYLLWDAGGPGTSPLDPGASRAALPTWTTGFDLVVLAEPWTETEVSARCLAELAAESRRDPDHCPWRRLVTDVHEYARALVSFEKQEGSLNGVYAASYGAVRALPAVQRVTARGGFAVIESPAPPLGTSATTIVRSRLEAAERAIVWTSACARSECARRYQILGQLLRGDDQVDPDDVQLALLGMSYSPQENEAFLRNLWRHGGKVDRVGAVSLRQVASRVALVTGAGTALHERVGYLAGTCSMYSHWPAGTSAFARMHRACATISPNGYDSWADHHRIGTQARKNIALVVNRRDPVVPWALQRLWRADSVPANVFTFARPGHVTMPESVAAEVGAWLDQRQARSAR